MNNKKGIFQFFDLVFSLGILMAMAIFSYLLITNLFTQEILPEAETSLLQIIEDNGNDSVVRNLILDQKPKMEALDINLDLIFLGVWLGTTLFFFGLSYFMPPISKWEFSTFIFIGIVFILFWLNFVEQIFNWYVTQFITNVFTAAETNLPIFTWYLDNYILIVTVTMLVLLLINQFSREGGEQFNVRDQVFRRDDDTQFEEADFEETNEDFGGSRNV